MDTRNTKNFFFYFQLDPPDCQQLFLRGGSVNFLFDQAWTLSYAQQGRYQRILDRYKS